MPPTSNVAASTTAVSTGVASAVAVAVVAAAVATAVAACCPAVTQSPGRPAPSTAPRSVPGTIATGSVPRPELNRIAAQLALPLLWERDANGNGQLDPDELAVLWGVDDTVRADWVTGAGFTERFARAYASIADAHAHGLPDAGIPPADRARIALLRRELDQGRPALLRWRFTDASAEDRAIVGHVLGAAKIIEQLFAEQKGAWALRTRLAPYDTAGRMVFYRNQDPWCAAPLTEADPGCNALPDRPGKLSGLYPADLQADAQFCEKLKERPNAEALRSPFTVVRREGDELVAVPYHVAYAPQMQQVARALDAAAAAIKSSDEQALARYLGAAAAAFRDGSWEQADEAWAKMSVHNSKWYLRIGPDEVYFEPCNLKAGFHASFARINPRSLAWQRKLDPVKGQLEKALADLSGPPYQPRSVSFQLPDFVDMVLNAGDSRSPLGATIGQSLPNFGPVAREGRGRTVAMTNLYADADSLIELETQARSLLCPATMAYFTTDPEPLTMSTVLHEAAHNLGPSHAYQVAGQADRERFGGTLASTLEELKAQTAALFFTDWLAAQGLIERPLAARAHLRDLVWGFGHIAQGMYEADGKPKPYGQLAAVQLGWLVKLQAVAFDPDQKAASGTDVGCLEVRMDELPPAIELLMGEVAGIKARGDKEAAIRLLSEHVDAAGDQKRLLGTIRERWLRFPKATFVYAIER